MDKKEVVRGYKVFKPDWTCRGKKYTCPDKFEENVIPVLYKKGMHFCEKLIDCFNYYDFSPENHVAEVIAYGDVEEKNGKFCTNKLEIIKELSWYEVLNIVNIGKDCTGIGNSGNYNSGNCNSGNNNSGYYNTGGYNSGGRNTGDYNSGYYNNGYYNSGGRNTGNHNSGYYNTGNYNSGYCNTGNCNSGDYNKTNHSSGCFNTVEQKIYLFNKLSDWTFPDWVNSQAYSIIRRIEKGNLRWVYFNEMTDEEKEIYNHAKITNGYLKKEDNLIPIEKWNELSADEKEIIKSIPNFDKEIFKEITGIDVEND